jgi:23S rRNA (pseudouridine1915-N3)-methyltransferase
VRLTILAVGKLGSAFREAADDYLRRLRRHMEIAVTEVREAGKIPHAVEARRLEGARLRDHLPPAGIVVALDREGEGWTSEGLALHMQRWQQAGRPLTFLVGGSHGLEPSLLAGADERWSLGPITLPHQLARVVLLEQLYRAGTILRGEPYHK